MNEGNSPLHTPSQLNAALAGRYEVDREIGRGGMAYVYLARDVRHNRKVALKVLNADLGAALGADRFLTEIEVTANLHHPNLLPLFDSGEAGGLLFYVMPYVEGQTLRQRLEREGQLPVDEAIRIAVAVAAALGYAHRHGVIHRDLKPENILLHEQQPLVMDFGIARAVSNAGGERLTQLGMSLGTPQYMSPEQATGDRDIDARSDVYSLAAVLYEMLTGHPPHSGNTVQAVIAKVIIDRPASVRSTREMVPPYVETAVMRALAKLPADRYTTAAEFAQALSGQHALVVRDAFVLATSSTPLPAMVPARLPLTRAQRVKVASAWTTSLIAAAALGAVAAIFAWRWPTPQYARFAVSLPDGVGMPIAGRAIAISPDGSRLAVVGAADSGSTRLYVRAMAGIALEPLRGTNGARSPSFSVDGKWLLYDVAGRLMKISSEGGDPLRLADSTDGQHSWGEGDRIVFIRGGAVWTVAAGGSAERLLARPDSSRGERAFAWPDVLPGGAYALLTIVRTEGAAPASNRLGVLTIADGKVKDLEVVGTGARFAAPNHVIFASAGGYLWAAEFSARKRAVTGDKVRLADGVHIDAAGGVDAAVSRNGTVVYGEMAGIASRGRGAHVALAIVDRRGTIKTLGRQRGNFYSPRVSPDAARIAITNQESVTQTDVWVYEIQTGQLNPLTRNGTSAWPEWADARRIVYRDALSGPGHFMAQPWDHGTVPGPFLTSSGTPTYSLSLGPAGGYLAATRSRPPVTGLRSDIAIARMSTPGSFDVVVTSPARELSPRVSPNGRWLAFASDSSGTFQLYVQPIPGPGPRVPVSIDNGSEPVWSRNGRELYYVSRGRLLAARVDETTAFRVPKQDTLFSLAERGFTLSPPGNSAPRGFYDVFPNGDFVMLARTAAADSSRANVIAVLHWERLMRTSATVGERR